MKPNEKLLAWRKNEAKLTIRGLVDLLESSMAPFFPDGFPRGERVFLPDISDAERGVPTMFEKVTNAIYKYLAVPEGYFGTLSVTVKEYEDLEEQSVRFRNRAIELQDKVIELQEQLIAEKSRTNELEQSRYELLTQLNALQQELATMKEEMARVKEPTVEGKKA